MAITNGDNIPYVGLEAFAAPHAGFDVDRFMAQYPKGHKLRKPALGLLVGTFGWDYSRILSAWAEYVGNKPNLIRWHISNGAGRRNYCLRLGEWARRLGPKKLDIAIRNDRRGILANYARRVRRVRDITMPYVQPNTKIVVSPELETNLKPSSIKKLIDIIRREWPEVHIVASREGRCGSIRGCWVEHHGREDFGFANIKSLDGVSVRYGQETYEPAMGPYTALEWAEVAKRKGTEVIFFWSASQQGAGQFRNWDGFKRLPPRTRTFPITDEAIDGFRYLLGEIG